jgi:phage terminase large subunit
MYILDEANEVRFSSFVDAAESTANKFLLPDSKIIYSYNPPPVRSHWSNTYFDNKIRKGATLIYTTWEDIRLLLKLTTIEEIENERDNDPRHYAYWYLGQQVSLEGLVLYTFKKERNLVSMGEFMRRVRTNMYQPVYVIYGVDSGVVKDATAVCAWGVFPDGKLLKLSTFYFEPRKHSDEPIPNSEQCKLIKEWYDKLYEKMRGLGIVMPTPYNEVWVFDNAVVTQDLMLEFKRKTMFNTQAVENKNIDRDIKRLQNGYFNGFMQILDWEDNKASLDEIMTFSYDEENKIPDGQADHTIDADKYATSFYYYQYLLG